MMTIHDSDFDELPLDDDELFAAPHSNLNYDPDEEKFVDVNDPWILLWIFKYQERFRLSDVAINSLIGFFSLVLKDINTTQFKEFPSTAYLAGQGKIFKILVNAFYDIINGFKICILISS